MELRASEWVLARSNVDPRKQPASTFGVAFGPNLETQLMLRSFWFRMYELQR